MPGFASTVPTRVTLVFVSAMAPFLHVSCDHSGSFHVEHLDELFCRFFGDTHIKDGKAFRADSLCHQKRLDRDLVRDAHLRRCYRGTNRPERFTDPPPVATVEVHRDDRTDPAALSMQRFPRGKPVNGMGELVLPAACAPRRARDAHRDTARYKRFCHKPCRLFLVRFYEIGIP